MDVITGPQALDAAKLLTAGGATVFVLVQLVKGFGYTTPRATVAVAIIASSALTALYALSAGVLEPRYAFDLVVAAVGMAATAAGINTAARTTATGQ